MALNTALVGKTYESGAYEVTDEAIEKYARATNDLNERYLGSGDVVASPIFPIVPAFPFLMKAALDPELKADVMRLVHGEEEHILYHPIRPGDVLTTDAVLESIEAKDTGDTFTIKVTETNQDGKIVADVRAGSFIRGTGARGKKAEVVKQAPKEIVYEHAFKVDADQPARYAEASGDHNPIHLDEKVARMAGLPGIINHGMCTMAMTVKGGVDRLAGGDPTRVTRVAARFSKIVLPPQELTAKFWKEQADERAAVYGFETYDPGGAAVMRNGTIEVLHSGLD